MNMNSRISDLEAYAKTLNEAAERSEKYADELADWSGRGVLIEEEGGEDILPRRIREEREVAQKYRKYEQRIHELVESIRRGDAN